MIRRLFTLAAFVSLLLWIGSLVLWGRGLVMGDRWALAGGERWQLHVTSGSGITNVVLVTSQDDLAPMKREHSSHRWSDGWFATLKESFHAFRIRGGGVSGIEAAGGGQANARQRIFDIPHWLLATVFALLPGLWLILWVRRKRIRPGHCARCGYDLRGSDGKTCPECGADADAEAM